jgi:hypothetical protein
MRGEDQHLHFGIRPALYPGLGLANRIDPAALYGHTPIEVTFFEGYGQEVTSFGGRRGLKVPGVNVR